ATGDLVAGRVVLREEDGAVASVTVEQVLDVLELGRRAERELTLASVALHRAAAFLVASREHDELRPAVGSAHVDAAAADEVPVDLAGGLVFDALFRREIHDDALGLV